MNTILDKVTFNFDNFNLSVSLKVEQGQLHSILGPSGSGKTTLLRIIAGFIKPSSGKILLNNKDITQMEVSKRNIGMVFQDYSLFPNMNVFNNIAYGLKLRKIDKKVISKKVDELLEIVNLQSYKYRKIFELSGGEKQRVALARALAPSPKLLLFDEPLSALDIKLRMELRREIKRIQKETGFSAVYVTHDQQEAMSISDKLTVINEGKIMQTDNPENIYNKPVNFFTANFVGVLNKVGNVYFRSEDCKICNDNYSERIPLKIIESEYLGGKYNNRGITTKGEKISFFSKNKIENEDNVSICITKKIKINDSPARKFLPI